MLWLGAVLLLHRPLLLSPQSDQLAQDIATAIEVHSDCAVVRLYRIPAVPAAAAAACSVAVAAKQKQCHNSLLWHDRVHAQGAQVKPLNYLLQPSENVDCITVRDGSVLAGCLSDGQV